MGRKTRILRRITVAFGLLGTLALSSRLIGDEPTSMAGRLGPAAFAVMIDDVSPPAAEACDDLTLLRRLTLDRFGRVPALSEIRDFSGQIESGDRASEVAELIRVMVDQPDRYVPGGDIDAAGRMADFWTGELTPPSTESGPTSAPLRIWLADQFRQSRPMNDVAAMLVDPASEGGRALFTASGGTTASYTAAISRGLLGVRMECAQCHDHPFTRWKMDDFWGLAAHFGDQPLAGRRGTATYEGQTFRAKTLDMPAADADATRTPSDLAAWITDAENPFFAANVVNRTYQQLVGKPLVSPVLDLDQADADAMTPLRELGQHFADEGFSNQYLISAVFLSSAYSSRCIDDPDRVAARPVKVLSPRQVFASLEQALLLPVGRIDNESARHNGIGRIVTQRLADASDADPQAYVAGVPQTLMMMNGPLTSIATGDRGRLLSAVVDAPFFATADDRVDVLFLATLTRLPTDDQRESLRQYRDTFVGSEKEFLADLLWTLINSPEVILCR